MAIPPALPPYTSGEIVELRGSESQRVLPLVTSFLPGEETEHDDGGTNANRPQRRLVQIRTAHKADVSAKPAAPIAQHDVVVRAVSGAIAEIDVSTPDGTRAFRVSIDGMRESGSGLVNVGDQYSLTITQNGSAYIPRFTKKAESTVIPFEKALEPIDPRYIEFKLKQLKENNDSAA